MIARVIAIESGANYIDKRRRVRLSIEGATIGYAELKVTEEALGVIAVSLDDVLEVEFHSLTMHQRRQRDAENQVTPISLINDTGEAN